MQETQYVKKEEFLDQKPINKPNYYAIITSEVRYSTEISDSAKLLFGEITALSNKYGYAFPSNQYLAELYGVSVSTIQRRLKELKNEGFIKVILIRDKEDNQVLERRLYPITPHGTSDTTPHSTSDTTPHSTSGTYNNTRDNNINNNNKSVAVKEKDLEEIKKVSQNKFSKEQIRKIMVQTKTDKETFVAMVKMMLHSKTEIQNPIGWIFEAIKKGYKPSKSINSSHKNGFHNFKDDGVTEQEEQFIRQIEEEHQRNQTDRTVDEMLSSLT